MNQAILQPLPLASDNPFSSEQECIDIGTHAHHSPYAAGVPDQLRRESGILAQHNTGIINHSLPSTSNTRYAGTRPDAHSSRYQSGTTIPGSNPGSISHSPDSNASSLGSFPSFSTNSTLCSNQTLNNLTNPPYSSTPQLFSNFSQAYGMSTTRRMPSINESPASNMLPPTRSPGLGNPVSPSSISTSVRDNYTTSTPGLHRHPHPLTPRHSDLPRYSGTLPETPRSILTTAMSVPNSSSYGGMVNYSQADQSANSPPFNPQETFSELSCQGQPVTPQIEAKIDKGFFISGDAVWTCYRRNYFAVTVSFSLSPHIPNAQIFVNQGGKPVQVMSFAVQLSAAVEGQGGKSIELIQHTPKRDKGPQMTMKKELLAPTPPGKSHQDPYASHGMPNYHNTPTPAGPNLPYQNDGEQSHQFGSAGHGSNGHQQSFDRIQFKSATANNGKRRAQQQYYHLVVELYANIQPLRDEEPIWVKVASRSSSPVVVRGRSPSHYQNEGPHSSGASRGGSGSGTGGLGHPGIGSTGGQAFGRGYGNGMTGSRPSGMGGSMYRTGNTYSLDPSPVGSHSVSSASSLSGGPVEGLVGDQHMADAGEQDPKTINSYDGYQYFPSPIYESMPNKTDAPGLPLPDRRIKEEFPGPSALASGWQMRGCGRFQGIESSRGYYPTEMQAHTGY